ncbi:GNAT family N-acetyltransferase [Tropicimonas sp. IMCC34043]|uniref:GNAT family N-acetyltransferase n=1 Tax=Tropicimonas sp. IMCC34043 TaxID=2248760 RepID=UPI000E267C00|nr:GNAT family N-acetyltransferase [Tropicimonas sp. IMCC34043]
MFDQRDEYRIVTPRLTLRALRGSDASDVIAGVGNLEVSRWLTAVPHPYEASDADAFLSHASGRPDHWAICREGALIGVISCDGELGYWLRRDAWGHGYATEAAAAVVDHWFADPSRNDLEAGHDIENTASAAVLAKLGFTEVGSRRRLSRARGIEVDGRLLRLCRAGWEARRRLPNLVTARTRSRPLTAADAPRLIAIAGNPDIAPMMGSIPCPWPEDAAEAWIAHRAWQGRPGFCLGLCRPDGTLIGLTGISPMDEESTSSIMFLLDKSCWNAGLVSEALSALVAAVFRSFPLEILTADHFEDNPVSGRVLEKLGFEKIGEGMASSAARLEPAPVSIYRLTRYNFEARR